MPDQRDTKVSDHYTHGSLLGAIEAALAAAGKTRETVSVDDLAPVDEFHIGGREASEAFLDQLEIADGHHLLDIGCGLGGASRFTASRYGARVTGIDLTPEFVETGNALCGWVGLSERVALQQGSALSMPFAPATFDGAYMMHVGMNIADKATLFDEVARVLKPGAAFGIFDIMQTGVGDLTFPVPWAASAETSAVSPPKHYEQALEQAGFAIDRKRDRGDFAIAYFKKMQARIAEHGPPPLGLHVLMGESAPVKLGNVVENLNAGLIAPIEVIARKAG
jgi:ubiquinone/menaquinone biosynthesis C-methylase UbiE